MELGEGTNRMPGNRGLWPEVGAALPVSRPPDPVNGTNYWFGYYRKHPREKLPAIVLRIW